MKCEAETETTMELCNNKARINGLCIKHYRKYRGKYLKNMGKNSQNVQDTSLEGENGSN